MKKFSTATTRWWWWWWWWWCRRHRCHPVIAAARGIGISSSDDRFVGPARREREGGEREGRGRRQIRQRENPFGMPV